MIAPLRRVLQRPGAVATYFGYRVLAAWLVTLPLISVAASVGVDQAHAGDAILFEPGGLLLLEALRLALPQLQAHLTSSGLAVLVLGYLGLVPLAAMLIGLKTERPPTCGRWFGAAVAKLPSFSVLLASVALAQAALLALGLLLAPFTFSILDAHLGERDRDVAALVLVAVLLVCLSAFNVVQDLARAALVSVETRTFGALRLALELGAQRRLALLWRWLALGCGSVLLVLGAAALTPYFAVERAQSWRWFATLALHQGVVVALVLLRALWLAYLLELVESRRGAPSS